MKMSSSNGSSYPCPGCKASSTIPETQDNFFEFYNYRVILPGGEYICFDKATTKYLDDYFPNHASDSYEVPPACVYKQDGLFDIKTDDEVSAMAAENQSRERGKSNPKEIMIERRQKNAVEKVASSFYSFGKENLEPMFVLKDFKFLDFASNSAVPKEQKTYQFHGDHDILIISRREGVIFIQVKSVENTYTRTCWQELHDAFTKQLPKDEFAVKHMNQDLPFIHQLPMQKFVGVPNLTDEDLSHIKLCSIHRKLTLTGDKLKKEQLKLFLSERFTQKVNKKYILDVEQYRDLVSRYVGLVSSVKLRTVSEASQKVGRKVSRILLNPDQKKCVDNNAKRNIILGHFGTGKSLVLIKKAKMLAEKGEKVYVLSFSCVHEDSFTINPEDMDNLVGSLERMQSSKDNVNKPVVQSFIQHFGKGESPKKIFKVTPKIICDLLERSAKDSNVHYFLDELPLGVFTSGIDENDRWKELETFCESNKSIFMWIAISSYSVQPHKDKGFHFFNEMLPKSFEKTYFTRWMRVPKTVYELIQTVSDFSGENSGGLGSHGNAIIGPRHWWVELKECNCGNTNTPLKCSCVGPQRLRAALREVMKDLKGISLNDITILFHESSDEMKGFLTKATKDACKGNFAYKLCVHGLDDQYTSEEVPEPAITVGNIWSHKGNESKVLIFLDPFGGQIIGNAGKQTANRNSIPRFTLAASRCLAHFIFITWPEKEKLSLEVPMEKKCLFDESGPKSIESQILLKDLLQGGEKALMNKVLTKRSDLIEKKNFNL